VQRWARRPGWCNLYCRAVLMSVVSEVYLGKYIQLDTQVD
jgi:hypothetical protein